MTETAEHEATAAANGNGTHHELPEDEPQAEFIMQANGQLSMSVGGKRPSGASLRIVGGRVDVNGEFQKGETIRVEMVLRVDEIAFVDEVDRETGQVVGCERRHKARMILPPTILAAE